MVASARRRRAGGGGAVVVGLVLCVPLALADDLEGAARDLEVLDRGIYEASGVVAPTHPVTGRPVFNVVPEPLEVRLARDFFRQYAEQTRARGAAVDPPGPRLARMRAVFAELVAVAHRPGLPWRVHLVEDPSANAFTAGGGLVVLLTGLWDDLLDAGADRTLTEDEALAVVLAHEIAHVSHLHPPLRTTWLRVAGVLASGTRDPYYQAAYSHEQETEADRLSVLYLALAGFDPLAASRLWTRVARQRGDTAGGAGYRHDHPISSERVRITAEAGRAVRRYWRPGRRHPRPDQVLADNVLYPRMRDDGYQPGDGLWRAATAVLDLFRMHRRASSSRDQRIAAAQDQARVRVVGSRHGATAGGEPGLVLAVRNGADRTVAGLALSLYYWNRGALLLIDECRSDVRIGPRSVRELVCPRQGVESDRIEPLVADVRWTS